MRAFLIRLPQVISRILYKAIIYLFQSLPIGIKLPTHRSLKEGKRVTFQTSLPRPIWHFSTQGLPPNCITAICWELLPPIFTLIRRGGRLFSVALSVSDKSEPGYSPVRRSMLSGLSSLVSQRDSVLRHIKIN